MHARAHGIPTTPLTSDTSTATLSSVLTATAQSTKNHPTSFVVAKIKTEPVDEEPSTTSACAVSMDEAALAVEHMQMDESPTSSSQLSSRRSSVDSEAEMSES